MDKFSFSSILDGKSQSLPEQIASHIMRKIFKGELTQGTRLIESDIAEELNVSNIPVRESFYLLQNTGVVERLPRRGVRVKSFSQQEMDDYTEALVRLSELAIDYSEPKWDEEKRDRLRKYLVEAERSLSQNDILEYVVNVHRLCGHIFQVAENIAFMRIYSDITFITNAYSQLKWSDVEKTRSRYAYLEQMVQAILRSDFAQAKEAFEILIRQSLNL
ncbi:GntR family transcriptional regulator [Cohnella fermenti]|uniref:GntR family transcriptional regulator n=1 Tax=Cohnella fermenti TaxID=2565925 RepID=A0A4S4C1U4_9BACL|nr:GntR family transcriptional regulator [Cohnella fermenti]THF81631.1 GntR family transcriptional regulator [Cohnella fermenti]